MRFDEALRRDILQRLINLCELAGEDFYNIIREAYDETMDYFDEDKIDFEMPESFKKYSLADVCEALHISIDDGELYLDLDEGDSWEWELIDLLEVLGYDVERRGKSGHGDAVGVYVVSLF